MTLRTRPIRLKEIRTLTDVIEAIRDLFQTVDRLNRWTQRYPTMHPATIDENIRVAADQRLLLLGPIGGSGTVTIEPGGRFEIFDPKDIEGNISNLRVRRMTAAAWTAADPILPDGVFGFESDTRRLKVGDGSTAWTALAYTI